MEDANLLGGLMTSLSDHVYFKDRKSRFIRINDALARAFGLSDQALAPGKTDADFFTEEHARQAFEDEQRVMTTGEPLVGLEEKETWPDGRVTWVSTTKVPLRDSRGEVVGLLGVSRDITDRKKIEEQLRASQKMEAIGRLAGGVAHDFNNILGVIVGYGEMVLRQLDERSPLHRKQQEVVKAAQRAADLTQQLLAFSRRQVLEPKFLDLNEVVSEICQMLRRLVGEDLELRTCPAADLGSISADRGQLGQILMNLAVNARDAMPTGGHLTIETANVELDAAYAVHHPPVQAGQYVMLAVSDTGCGMDADVLAHIFEPFFTTKGIGKGTGLGLATVYGIVKQSGGYIRVYSEPHVGTTFKLYFPRVDTLGSVTEERPATPPRGTETVLLVEDDTMLGNAVRDMLREGGYTVLLARAGGAALEIAEEHNGPIDLVITDVIMPGMNGRQVAQQIMCSRPQARVLYVSGYTGEAISHHHEMLRGAAFLSKPFSSATLLHRCRELLDAPCRH